ncbi:5'-nucleotidase C-terminal domain-containing protein [Inconstantimicrobium porci]|uniref:2',3'-cyclic-nucleotide 2'-phosphodiesterase n=1 Tax=Inconstantimicrobium porci TaxID=2652291 RepID=A0A7X2MXU7_9CLOT|nr:5'-nucleotidase C-terminal domain-containing protein [Inconstantimicrobium porci]MSR91045.1 2',3'-cyclic-nucleotide 2'-phosphodiesterase [Inconstantimicrobium porci]
MLNHSKKCSLLSLIVASAMTFSLITPMPVKASANDENNESVVNLQILSTTDTHGRFLPYDYAINAENTSGSLAQVSTKVKELRAVNPNTIMVDAGDIIQDNSESLFLDGESNPMATAMNEIGYDTITLGNHEFNYGIPTLNKVKKLFKATVLCGNVYDKDGTTLGAPYKVVEKGGVKVGIVGMVTPNITRWDGPNLSGCKVTNSVDETKKAISELKKQGINTIVAVDHMGINQEYGTKGSSAIDILNECPEITAFVAAHFHNNISGSYYYNGKVYSSTKKGISVISNDGTEATGTVEAYNEAKEKGTVIVEAGKWGQNLAQINLKLTKNKEGKFEVANKGQDITSTSYSLKGVEADPVLVEKLKPFSEKAIADANTPIGTLRDGDLVPENEVKGIEQAKLQPTPMIDLINKVQMYYGEKVANHKIDVSSAAAFKDGANIKEGTIKKCGTADIYKFDNTLYVLKISGKSLKKYMEWSASYYNQYLPGDLTVSFNKSMPGYNYDMFTGLKYQVDISKEVGKRITGLTKYDGTPINDEDELYLSCNNYRASSQLLSLGPVFKDQSELPILVGKSEQTEGLGDGRIRDLIGSYIKDVKGGTITPECDNNWSVIGNNWNVQKRALAVAAVNQGDISLSGIAGEQTSNNSKSVTWSDVKDVLEKHGKKVVDVVSFNDFHGSLENSGKNTGMSKFVNSIKEYKNANKNTIVVSGGDNYQGSAMSNLTYGKPVSAMLKQIGITASAVGNHEFDWGTAHLTEWSKDGNFDFLASNIYDKKSGKPVSYAKPYKIVDMNGVKVGFVGLTTPETEYKTKAENVKDIEFKDPATAAKEWADKLKSGSLPEGKADVVIALTHIGSSQDSDGKITGEVVDYKLCDVGNLDAIVSAHSHQPVCGYVDGKDAKGKTVKKPVVQGYYNGRSLTDMSIIFDPETNKHVVLPSLDNLYQRQNTLKDDAEALKTYKQFEEELKPTLNRVVGITDTDLTHDSRGHHGTSVLGKWVCDVMKDAAKTQIAMTNGGGIRASINKRSITMGDLYTVMPFDNTLVTMNVTGSEVKKLIEHGIYNDNIGWIQVSGIKVYYDKNKEAGNRISAMCLDDGSKIEDNKTYSLVTNDFMATNGDGYNFDNAKNVVDTGVPVRDAMVEALEKLTKEGKHLNYNYFEPLIDGQAPANNSGNKNPGTGNQGRDDNKPGAGNHDDDKQGQKPGEGTTTPVVKPNDNNNSNNKPQTGKPADKNNGSNGSTKGKSDKNAVTGTMPKTGSMAGEGAMAAVAVVLLVAGCAIIIDKKKKAA